MLLSSEFIRAIAIIVALLVVGVGAFLVGYFKGKKYVSALWERSRRQSRSVLGGVFSEQVAPFLPNFPKDLKASEARFIGKPIDFLIFKGMDEQNITEIVFVEVKSGKSQLNTNERKLRDAIREKRVSWYEYRVQEGIAKISGEAIPDTSS
jgi:predicted Holliday junction resolvase-like endonuclease